MRLRTIFLGATLGGLTLALTLVGLYKAVDRQAEEDEARAADVIIVLGSQVRADGQPSNSLRSRIERGVELYQAGYAPTLFLTGGVGRFPPAEAEAMRRVALAAAIPDSALVLDTAATSTQESMLTAAREAQARGWRTALVVSDPFHMLRARQMARDVGFDAYGAPTYDSRLYTVDRLRRFYTLRETLALVWYYTVGRLGMTEGIERVARGLERTRFAGVRHAAQGRAV